MKHALIIALALFIVAPVALHADEPPKVAIQVLEEGAGEPPTEGDLVTIDYKLTLADGTEIGSTYARNRPFTVTLDTKHTIQGMLDALLQMKPGSKAKVTIPSALAYGTRGKPSRTKGKPAVIPPNTDIIYEVVIRDIVRRPKFAEVDLTKATKTATGLNYWVLDEGEGEVAKVDQRATLAYAIWNQKKELVYTSHDRKHWVDGKVDKLQLFQEAGRQAIPAEPILREAALMMKPGARYFFEAPSDLTWGSRTPSALIAPGSKTFWEIEMLAAGPLPALKIPDEATATKTASGLRYEVIAEGEGRSPKASSMVEVHYTGWLTDGRKFDSSFDRGHTQDFQAGRVVPGFKEALLLMKEGGKAYFYLPTAIAYGAQGSGRAVPPNADLVFYVELKKVK